MDFKRFEIAQANIESDNTGINLAILSKSYSNLSNRSFNSPMKITPDIFDSQAIREKLN